ncbi:Gfo/Idh/MocA family protein [Sphingobium sp. CAP-1]|uniref:Gfo/Idh/MocA family protein n=1 Tax=Sphingobium sp. CAP-1 TaxID=2676077 RepID=UPI0012BB3DFB|nr:Gfo/Idh/MocA family oxidoreductase [Sphingobium sp. CAP-1]QGP80504.1 gfo/Idh/MocA family oxidoreductase [Sphingobium sp. CAP-1]
MSKEGQPLGAVVVGTGFGLFTHVRALRDAGMEVRAIIGRDRERTARRAAPLGIPLASDDLEQVLANDPAIRLVTVATPPHAHYRPVMQAIAAGRAVMCEKPFARDLPQAREMLAAAEKAGIVHALGAEFRFDSAQALLRRVVKDGLIGDPLMFSRLYQQPGGDDDEPLADWWTDAAQGGGFLGAFGTHMIDQVLSTLGPITTVSAILSKLSTNRPAMTSDDYYNIQFVTKSGCRGVMEAAMTFPGPFVMATKVAGTKGAAWVQSGAAFGDPEEIWVKNEDGPRRIPMPPELVNPAPEPFGIAELIQTEMDRWHTQGFDVAPYAKLFGQMKARIEGRAPPLPDPGGDFRDAAAGQAVLDAARRSAAEGRWVEVEAI